MKGPRIVRIAVLVCCLGVPVTAQQAPAQQGDHLAALKASLQNSMTEVHQYQWVETTVISIKGEEKSRTESNCYYGADGTLQKTPIESEPESEGEEPPELGRKALNDYSSEAMSITKRYFTSFRISRSKASLIC